jgi:luciferase family oxidoreductase group 1
VLLPYYSPLKVAETFRMLQALFPDGSIPAWAARRAATRGRAAMMDGRLRARSACATGSGSRRLHRLHAGSPAPGCSVKAAACGRHRPEVWLLGSSVYSGALAAQLGLRFAFAHFISAHGGDTVSRAYRERYSPSAREPAPWSLVCVFVICAKTRAEAEQLAASIDLRRLHMARGIDAPVPTAEEARAHRYSLQERAYVEQQRARLVQPVECARSSSR